MFSAELVLDPGKDQVPGDYSRAKYYSGRMQNNSGDSDAVARNLADFIFATHPDVLDLPPGVLHRFKESERIMDVCGSARSLLHGHILEHFQTARTGFENGYALAETATVNSAAIQENGKFARKVTLPESVLQRALTWNDWTQNEIEKGRITELFGSHPNWVGVKLAEGSWLQAGNLMFEVTEGLARIRTPKHDEQNTEERLGAGVDSKDWGAGLDQWFVMSHIVDKELLELASKLNPNMIDGMHLTPEIYAKSYRPICELVGQNPALGIRDILSDGTWAYSSDLPRLFPNQAIASLNAIAGTVVDLGPATELKMQAQIDFATRNTERPEAFEEGIYQVGIATRFIDRKGMQAVMNQFGI